MDVADILSLNLTLPLNLSQNDFRVIFYCLLQKYTHKKITLRRRFLTLKNEYFHVSYKSEYGFRFL